MSSDGAPKRASVCILAPLAFAHRSGIGRYQTELVRALAPRLPLHLIFHPQSFPGKSLAELPAPLQTTSIHRVDDPRFLARNARSLFMRMATSLDLIEASPRATATGYMTRVVEGLEVDKHGFDLYHGTMNYLPRTRGKARRVVTILDTIPLDHPGEVQRTTRAMFLRPGELRNDDRVIFISKSAQASFRRRFDHPADHERVIYLGLDHGTFHEGTAAPSAGEPPYIVSVGMFEPRKNLLRALEAFERVAAEHPGLRWKITGAPGFGQDRFKQALSRSPARSQVDLMDIAGDAELARLYSGARALLFPSITEGFGLPVAEAIACGTPVAASWLPSVEEAGGGGFVRFDPLEVDSIREGILEACFDEPARERMRRKGVEHVAAFDWKRTVDQHLEVYAEALGRAVSDLVG